MTDLQLAILLRQLGARLSTELGKVEAQLPDSLSELRSNKFLGLASSEPVKCFPVLDGLWSIEVDLSTSADNLERPNA